MGAAGSLNGSSADRDARQGLPVTSGGDRAQISSLSGIIQFDLHLLSANLTPGTSGIDAVENTRHEDMKQFWPLLSKTHG